MSVIYAEGCVAYVSESPLGVVFVRAGTGRPDGSQGDVQFYDARPAFATTSTTRRRT